MVIFFIENMFSTRSHFHISSFLYVCMYVCVFVCMCVSVCMCVYLYVCVSISLRLKYRSSSNMGYMDPMGAPRRNIQKKTIIFE